MRQDAASILIFMGYTLDVDFIAKTSETGTIVVLWFAASPQPTEAEIEAQAKPYYASRKREEIYREQEIRSTTVWGKEVDRYMFAWIEEFYTDILKPAARNNITEAGAPITFGLKQLRDNRDTLLNGLDTWVSDPLKTAEDIAAFDVVNWSGWSVARP